MQALQRMFGVVADARRVRRQDFHVPAEEVEEPDERSLMVEAVFAFPELGAGRDLSSAVPAFWHQMAADQNGTMKCRLRLEATWTNNGLDGTIDDRLIAIKSHDENYTDEAVAIVRGPTRSQIQFVYVPAVRDAASHLAGLLRGRLWQSIKWSDGFVDELKKSGDGLNDAFLDERGVDSLLSVLTSRWQEVHGAGTHSQPVLRPINSKLEDFVRNLDVVFRPDETGRDRIVSELSDGQRSMFCISLVSATLDVENQIKERAEGFDAEAFSMPVLTLVGVEEPENNLMPFYLSRIVEQLREVMASRGGQALISSHSASVLSRIEPKQIRHFRAKSSSGSSVRKIQLPAGEDEYKYIREAVRAYPELYFASYVILGEGSSEEVVIPRVAEAIGLPIDRSFVAIVPLGGRHVNHFWRLLNDLDIPHSTLLDLDLGRSGGGHGRIKYAIEQLEAIGVPNDQIVSGTSLTVSALAEASMSRDVLDQWIAKLRQHRIYYSYPLDIDMSMLVSLPEQYQEVADGGNGPSDQGDPVSAVLGEKGDASLLEELPFTWYRYLFLGRGKPTTHARSLSKVEDSDLALRSPEELRALVDRIASEIPNSPFGGVQ